MRNNLRKEALVSRSGETKMTLIRPRIMSSKAAAIFAVEIDPERVAAGMRGGRTLSWSLQAKQARSAFKRGELGTGKHVNVPG